MASLSRRAWLWGVAYATVLVLGVVGVIVAVVGGTTGSPGTAAKRPGAASLAQSGASVSTQHSRAVYFDGDPNLTGNLRPWQWIETGDRYSTTLYPGGISSPGVVTVASDPLDQLGMVYRITVTPTSNYVGGTRNADWAALFNGPTSYWGRNGENEWVHFSVMFPSGAYRPTRGEFNWVFEAHDDPGFLPWYDAGEISVERPELALGVANDHHSFKQLLLQVRGGQDRHMGDATEIYTGRKLQYDHWFDIVIHVIWSSMPAKGLVVWWVDGQLVSSRHLANLWQRPDGSYDHVNFELNNYRRHASWRSTLYYGRAEIGPTSTSVAFPPAPG